MDNKTAINKYITPSIRLITPRIMNNNLAPSVAPRITKMTPSEIFVISSFNCSFLFLAASTDRRGKNIKSDPVTINNILFSVIAIKHPKTI